MTETKRPTEQEDSIQKQVRKLAEEVMSGVSEKQSRVAEIVVDKVKKLVGENEGLPSIAEADKLRTIADRYGKRDEIIIHCAMGVCRYS